MACRHMALDHVPIDLGGVACREVTRRAEPRPDPVDLACLDNLDREAGCLPAAWMWSVYLVQHPQFGSLVTVSFGSSGPASARPAAANTGTVANAPTRLHLVNILMRQLRMTRAGFRPARALRSADYGRGISGAGVGAGELGALGMLCCIPGIEPWL